MLSTTLKWRQSILETVRLNSLFLFPTYPPPPQKIFLTVEEEWIKMNNNEALLTCFVKVHLRRNFRWTDRKRGICPAKGWSSSVQRMPVNFCHNPKLFLLWSNKCFPEMYLNSAAGFLLWQTLRNVTVKTNRAQRNRTGCHCCKHISPNPLPGFP